MFQTKNQLFNHPLTIRLQQYFKLTKPRIVLLLALTGVIGYLLPDIGANAQIIHLLIFLWCGYCAAGGAMAVNNAIDRDIDNKMDRTKNRPSIELMSTLEVTIFGTILMLIGLAIAFVVFGVYTTLFLAWGALYYIFGYSFVLKRSTWLNTILGGLASPAPVWAAFAARAEIGNLNYSTGFLGVPLNGWLLGFLVFLWTPSHTWAMAVKNYDDYVRAEVPMLPVILGIPRTAKLNATLSLIVVSYALWLVALLMSPVRFWIALWVSIPFLLSGVYFARNPTVESGKQNFIAHNIWLALIFVTFL